MISYSFLLYFWTNGMGFDEDIGFRMNKIKRKVSKRNQLLAIDLSMAKSVYDVTSP